MNPPPDVFGILVNLRISGRRVCRNHRLFARITISCILGVKKKHYENNRILFKDFRTLIVTGER